LRDAGEMVHRRNIMPGSEINGTLVVATATDPSTVYALTELATLTAIAHSSVLGSRG